MKSKIVLATCLLSLVGFFCDAKPCGESRLLYYSVAEGCHHKNAFKLDGEELFLGDLIALGLENNPDTARSWAASRSAYASYRQSLSTNYPEIKGRALAEHHHVSDEDKDLIRYDLVVSYLLFDFGNRAYNQMGARLAFSAARWNKDFVFQKVILEVIERYTDLMRAIATRKAREADLQDAQISLDVAEAQYQAGVRDKADYLQVKAEFASAQIRLEEAIGGAEIAMGRLKNAVGVSVQTPLPVAPIPKDFSPEELNFVVDTLIETGQDARKDLAAICAIAKSKRAEWKAARALGMPRLTTEWNFGETYSGSSREHYHNSGMLVLSVPIFSGYFFTYNAERARQDYLTARVDYRNSELQVGLEILTNYWNLKTAYNKYLLSLEYLAYAEEAYQSTLENYKAGVGGLQALINSQDKLATARTDEVQSKSEWMISLARLIFSTGLLDEQFLTKKGQE